MIRKRLPQRRRSETVAFEHAGIHYLASASRFDDGRLAEVFLALTKPGGALDDMARDLAVTASLALQHGCPVKTLRSALTAHPTGA
jgi:ribonucleoside-diphosphate reductase alpha chain